MDELNRGQDLLREEVNQLKSQMGWVMETLQALLRREPHTVIPQNLLVNISKDF